jgi:hypothetical protein
MGFALGVKLSSLSDKGLEEAAAAIAAEVEERKRTIGERIADRSTTGEGSAANFEFRSSREMMTLSAPFYTTTVARGSHVDGFRRILARIINEAIAEDRASRS